jgi:hypothetical protein
VVGLLRSRYRVGGADTSTERGRSGIVEHSLEHFGSPAQLLRRATFVAQDPQGGQAGSDHLDGGRAVLLDAQPVGGG